MDKKLKEASDGKLYLETQCVTALVDFLSGGANTERGAKWRWRREIPLAWCSPITVNSCGPKTPRHGLASFPKGKTEHVGCLDNTKIRRIIFGWSGLVRDV